MEIDTESLLWVVAILIVVFVVLILWILGNYKAINRLEEHNVEYKEEMEKWEERYEHDVGKHIKDVLSHISRLEIEDKRDTENIIMDISYKNYKLDWNDRTDKLQM